MLLLFMIRNLQIKQKEGNMNQATIKDFIKNNNLSISSSHSDSNPNMDNQDMNHYKVTIKRKFKLDGNHLDTRYGFKQMTIFYSQGFGIEGEPKLDSVLDCLLCDSLGVDGEIFEDFCDNFGYEIDSPLAKKSYNATIKNTNKLKNLLDNKYYDLIKCERL
tara:strand:- start:1551 stop:2033 length:483 start_codon:yes stop_codon:yes gene_type:complete